MIRKIVARYVPELKATILSREKLWYSAGPDPKEDRPPHVRSASGLCWSNERLAIIQDDANFVALVTPSTMNVDAIALPRGAGGWRLFDKSRGNKDHKLDLEACLTVPDRDGEVLVIFGSGSTPFRENIILVRTGRMPGKREVLQFHCSAFYNALRKETDFSGSELNIEGAVFLSGGGIRLFQRGNGAIRGDLRPVNATCDITWGNLDSSVRTLSPDDVPGITNIVNYELGMLDGVSLSFTDADCLPDGRTIFLACAEDSPDTVQDGRIAGTVFGIIEENNCFWGHIVDRKGKRQVVKAEGLVHDRFRPHHVFMVLDADDPDAPSELCHVLVENTGK